MVLVAVIVDGSFSYHTVHSNPFQPQHCFFKFFFSQSALCVASTLENYTFQTILLYYSLVVSLASGSRLFPFACITFSLSISISHYPKSRFGLRGQQQQLKNIVCRWCFCCCFSSLLCMFWFVHKCFVPILLFSFFFASHSSENIPFSYSQSRSGLFSTLPVSEYSIPSI